MNEMMFNALMDPAGAPAHPVLFLVLGVVTFALHITAVALMLGTIGVALYGAVSKNPHAVKLAVPLSFTAKVAVGAAIVLGVAPLLFVQVIYDPFWYTSNVVSAVWAIAFLGILIVAYLMLYRVQALVHKAKQAVQAMPKGAIWLALALVLLIVCGVIMHALTNQMLSPKEFMNWYAPGGVIDPSGTGLFSINVPRVVFFLALSMPVTAAWLYGLRRYQLFAGNTDYDYIDWLEAFTHKLALVGSVILTLAGIAWMVCLPENQRWFTGLWAWIGLVPCGYMLAMAAIQKKRRLCTFCNYMAFIMTVIMTIVLAALREVLRYGTLAADAGWDALAYRINFDWASTVIFFVTFLVVGGSALGYLLTLAWQAGQKQGQVTEGAGLRKLGNVAVLVLTAWVILYFVVGVATVTTAN